MTSFLTFAIATLVLNLTPGPDMMYVASRSLGQGRRAGIVSALGITAGLLFHTTLVAFGVATVLRWCTVAFPVIRCAGAAYLVFLGLRMSLRRRTEPRAASMPIESTGAIFRQGVITNVLNPKVALFFLAFLPQFVSPARGRVASQLAVLGLYFIFSGTLVNLAVAGIAGLAGDFLRAGSRRQTVERASGAMMIALGLRLGLSRAR